MGAIELCLLLEQVGRHVAPIPALPTLVSAALPIAEHGTEAQRARFLPGVVRGELVLTAALTAPDSRDPLAPSVRAVADGGAWRLHGRLTNVAFATESARVLVPARLGAARSGGAAGDGPLEVGVFLLDSGADGVTLRAQRGTNGQPLREVHLDGAVVAAEDVLALDAGASRAGTAALRFAVEWTLLGVCALEFGVAGRALAMTAAYATERRQFGVPIGTFQGVTQRLGDAYIDVQAMDVSLWKAAWRLSERLDASRELAVAKLWASEGGSRVVCAAQHIHGGMGFDRDYPLFRYFLTSRQLELTLGGPQAHLRALGELL